ncbi:hypothetical protein JG687_00019693 [Phytophthora cactorum]|uniref:Uncharacterized protein n=1 Tax=Phytophthora cactorum TaxID=29920 RepID=A0A8T1TIU1_9STRA|nr:hypothetical protein JG687_00019693 [Phytophthora cactorum]
MLCPNGHDILPYHTLRAPNCESIDSFYYPLRPQATCWTRLESVALIFVGAIDSGPSVTSNQPIAWSPAARFSLVSIIPNIGDAKTEALSSISIKTDGVLAQCASDFSRFVKRQKLTKKMLVTIPQ